MDINVNFHLFLSNYCHGISGPILNIAEYDVTIKISKLLYGGLSTRQLHGSGLNTVQYMLYRVFRQHSYICGKYPYFVQNASLLILTHLIFTPLILSIFPWLFTPHLPREVV